MRMILTFLLTLMIGASSASAVSEFDYEFLENCPHPNHGKMVSVMTEMQGKMTEVIRNDEVAAFYRAWSEMANQQYTPEKYDVVDAIFVYKSYPSVGVLFAFKNGCFIGNRLFSLDQLNKHLGIYYRIRDKGDL